MSAAPRSSVRMYGMQERADHLDFDIRFQGARSELAQPHRHEYFQIQFGIRGASMQSIGGATRPFGPAYLSYVLPYRVHVIPHPPGALYCIVNFHHDFLWPHLDVDLLDLEGLPISRYPDLSPFLFQEYIDFHFEPEDFVRIRSWLDEMLCLNRLRTFGAMSTIRGLLQQIIGLTCMRHSAALLHQSMQQDGKTSQHDALQRVIRYVRDNLEKEMSLTEAAAAACLSPNYLAHLLKKETGRTFTEMVTERRLERAKELLSTSRQQVKGVAYQCGFSDEAYFNRRFRQWVGMTPKQYRDQQVATLRT
ncbi:MAG TPA: AraC family transcriptional regulator [Eoetvoesiella sp.]